MRSKVFFIFIFTLFIFSCSEDRKWEFRRSLTSPDGLIDLIVDIEKDGGKICYKINKRVLGIEDRKLIIEKSYLGMEGWWNSHTGAYKNFKMPIRSRYFKVDTIEYDKVNEQWDQVWGEQKTIVNKYNEMAISGRSQWMKSETEVKITYRFRIFNDGVAFRYEIIPSERNLMKDDYEIVIDDELTQFNFAEDSPSWWIPAYAYRRYEFLYANTLISEISREKFSEEVEYLNGPRIGPEAVQTPFTVQREDGITIAIHEANLTNYSSMTLKANGTKNMECDLFPWSDGVKVRRTLKRDEPLITPWRTIIVADNPAELAMSTLTLNLNEPNKLSNTDWIKPGKYIGLWWEMIGTNQSSWGSGAHHGAKTERVLEYIDFGSKYNFDGVLVEGWNTGWDENWCCTGEGESFDFYHPHPDFDNKKITEYAQDKGIRIIGHHETGTQIDNYESQLDSAFAYCNRNGIRVVKTGYVNDGIQNIKRLDEEGNIHKEWHHGQYMVEHFRKVLETAAKYNVSIVVHEPIKDTGLRRTYPNMLSREGARGQEFNGFMPKDYNNKPNHTTILPFTRLLSSPMDYTPGIFNLKEYRHNSPDDRTINTNHHIPSTIAKELALYVIIYAPVQMAADLPQNYENHPAFKFILDVPTDWDKTLVLNGEIGKYITTVRKDINSNDWYLGSITNEDARELKIELSFLDSDKTYKATIYKDPIDGGWENNPEKIIIENILVNKNNEYKLILPSGGGQAIRFSLN